MQHKGLPQLKVSTMKLHNVALCAMNKGAAPLVEDVALLLTAAAHSPSATTFIRFKLHVCSKQTQTCRTRSLKAVLSNANAATVGKLVYHSNLRLGLEATVWVQFKALISRTKQLEKF